MAKNKIKFEIENNFDASEYTEGTGIGLKNLKRRLELVYPKKHELQIPSSETVCHVVKRNFFLTILKH